MQVNLNQCVHLLGEISNLSVNVTAVQETHFTFAADFWCWRMTIVLSAYDSRSSVDASLLIGGNINVDENLVLADDGGRLVVADVAVKFRVPGGRSLCTQYRCREGFFSSAVNAVPWLSEMDSSNRWLILARMYLSRTWDA